MNSTTVQPLAVGPVADPAELVAVVQCPVQDAVSASTVAVVLTEETAQAVHMCTAEVNPGKMGALYQDTQVDCIHIPAAPCCPTADCICC